MKKILLLIGICALMLGMISCEKTTTDIKSNNSGVLIGSNVYDTIQDAIDAAVDGDTLRLTQGIYAGNNNTNLMWDGEEKHLTIMTDLRGHQQDYAIIEGNGKGAGFYFGNSFQSNADLIYGITIRNMGSEAFHDAAFYCENAEPTIQYCYVSECRWGGVFCFNANPRIENSWFYNNKVGFIIDGGSNPVLLLNYIVNSELDGVYALGDSYPAVFNNLIMDNERGGVYLLQAKALMVNNTIVGNSQWGIKIRADELSQMINCIVWDNGTAFDVIEEDVLTASFTCAPSENPDVNPVNLNNIYNNPLFVSAVDYQLQSTSPCIDIGNTGVVGWTEDLNDDPRIHNNTVDLGVYESQTEIHSDNSGVLIGSNVYDTIQGAIDAAVDGDTLRLTQGIYAGNNNTNLMWDGEEKHLTIMTDLRGYQPDYAIIEGNGKGAGFYFGNSFQSNADLIYGITIRNMGSDAEYYNAAFYCENAEPTIQYCYVYECGWCAVYCSHADPRIENSWFYDNYAGFIIDGESDPVLLLNYIENCELDGVYAIDDSNPSLFNNLIADNKRGVYILNAKSLMVNNTIASNTNWGVRVNSDLLSQMINCIVWNNGIDLDVLSGSSLVASYTCSPIEYPDVNPESLGNIYDDPQFIAGNDYHLKSVSPCLDIGNQGVVGWDKDLDGEPRFHNNEIDLGAYEWHP